MALRGLFSCPNLDQMDWERKREGKCGIFRERSSTFSLEFWRSDRRAPKRQETKLLPTARTTRGYQFRGVSTNSRNVGVFSYLLYFLFKGHVMDGDLLRPGWPLFRFQKIWTD